MNKPNDIPAFPGYKIVTVKNKFNPSPHDNIKEPYEGMLLRDYFAGQVLIGIISTLKYNIAHETCEKIAEDAYEMANAMLAQREVN